VSDIREELEKRGLKLPAGVEPLTDAHWKHHRRRVARYGAGFGVTAGVGLSLGVSWLVLRIAACWDETAAHKWAFFCSYGHLKLVEGLLTVPAAAAVILLALYLVRFEEAIPLMLDHVESSREVKATATEPEGDTVGFLQTTAQQRPAPLPVTEFEKRLKGRYVRRPSIQLEGVLGIAAEKGEWEKKALLPGGLGALPRTSKSGLVVALLASVGAVAVVIQIAQWVNFYR
jgi:hypothetical protein